MSAAPFLVGFIRRTSENRWINSMQWCSTYDGCVRFLISAGIDLYGELATFDVCEIMVVDEEFANMERGHQ